MTIAEKRIALILSKNEDKIAYFDRMLSRTIYLTSSDSVSIREELYPHGIIRYVVEGTRASWTATVDINNGYKVIRKPYGIKPLGTRETYNCSATDIETMALDMIATYKEAEGIVPEF